MHFTNKQSQSERLLILQCTSLPNTLVQRAHPDIRSAIKAPPRRGKHFWKPKPVMSHLRVSQSRKGDIAGCHERLSVVTKYRVVMLKTERIKVQVRICAENVGRIFRADGLQSEPVVLREEPRGRRPTPLFRLASRLRVFCRPSQQDLQQ